MYARMYILKYLCIYVFMYLCMYHGACMYVGR